MADLQKVLPVDTQWVEDHLKDPKVRIAEVDYDRKTNYELAHIPGSVLFDWKKDINEPLSRNILTRHAFEELLQREGVNNDTTLAWRFQQLVCSFCILGFQILWL